MLPFVYLYKTLWFLHQNVAVRLLVQNVMVFTQKRCRSFTCTKTLWFFHENLAVRLVVQNVMVMVFTRKCCRLFSCTKRYRVLRAFPGSMAWAFTKKCCAFSFLWFCTGFFRMDVIDLVVKETIMDELLFDEMRRKWLELSFNEKPDFYENRKVIAHIICKILWISISPFFKLNQYPECL